MSDRASRLAALIVAAVTFAAAAASIAPWPVGGFEDDAAYVVLAKSLATGEGYRFLNLPGSPPATHFPPGYPLVLAALWKLSPRFPENVALFKLANAVFLSAAAVAAFRFARARLGFTSAGAAATTLAATATVPVLLVTGVVMSEPLFLALLLPTLLLCEGVVDRERTPGAGPSRGVALAAAAGAACGVLALVRTLGIAALPALALALVLRRRWLHAAAALGCGALVITPWVVWTSGHADAIPPVLIGKYGSYGPWLAAGVRDGGLDFVLAVVRENAAELAGWVTFALMPTAPAWPRMATLAAIIPIAGVGVIALWRSAPVTAAFLLAYLSIVLAWPFEPVRFLLAITPLVAFVLALGVRALVRQGAERGAPLRVAALAAGAAWTLGFGAYNLRGVRERWWEAVQRESARSAVPVARWVATHTAPTDVVSTEHELLVHLYTGRRALPITDFTPAQRVRPPDDGRRLGALRSIIERWRPRFVIAGSPAAARIADQLGRMAPSLLRRYDTSGPVHVFETAPND